MVSMMRGEEVINMKCLIGEILFGGFLFIIYCGFIYLAYDIGKSQNRKLLWIGGFNVIIFYLVAMGYFIGACN